MYQIAHYVDITGVGLAGIDPGSAVGITLSTDAINVVKQETVVRGPADDAAVGGVGNFEADDINVTAADVNAEELTLGVDFGGPTGVGGDSDALVGGTRDVYLHGFVVGAGKHPQYIAGLELLHSKGECGPGAVAGAVVGVAAGGADVVGGAVGNAKQTIGDIRFGI